MDKGILELGEVSVREFREEDYEVEEMLKKNGLIEMRFRIGVGRRDEEKRKKGEEIFEKVKEFMEKMLEKKNLEMKMEIREIDKKIRWKKKEINKRMRKKKE